MFFPEAAPPPTRKEVLFEHDDLRRRLSDSGSAWQVEQEEEEGSLSQVERIRPCRAPCSPGPRSSPFGALRSLRVADVCSELPSEYPGCVLRGRLVVPPVAVKRSVHTVLEDDQGEVVKVCLHNYLPRPAQSAALPERQSLAAQVAPQGCSIAIVEPFYTEFLDGSEGLWVEKAVEVVQLVDDTTVSKFLDQASHHLASKQPQLAMDAATQGLHTWPHTQLLTTLLCNAAACLLPLGCPGAALQAAALALAVDGACHKALFRAAAALDAMATNCGNGEVAGGAVTGREAGGRGKAKHRHAQGQGQGQGGGAPRSDSSEQRQRQLCLAQAARWAASESVRLHGGGKAQLAALLTKLQCVGPIQGDEKSGGTKEADEEDGGRGRASLLVALVDSVLDDCCREAPQGLMLMCSTVRASGRAAGEGDAACGVMSGANEEVGGACGPQAAVQIKDRGNAAFQAGDHGAALRLYRSALHALLTRVPECPMEAQSDGRFAVVSVDTVDTDRAVREDAPGAGCTLGAEGGGHKGNCCGQVAALLRLRAEAGMAVAQKDGGSLAAGLAVAPPVLGEHSTERQREGDSQQQQQRQEGASQRQQQQQEQQRVQQQVQRLVGAAWDVCACMLLSGPGDLPDQGPGIGTTRPEGSCGGAVRTHSLLLLGKVLQGLFLMSPQGPQAHTWAVLASRACHTGLVLGGAGGEGKARGVRRELLALSKALEGAGVGQGCDVAGQQAAALSQREGGVQGSTSHARGVQGPAGGSTCQPAGRNREAPGSRAPGPRAQGSGAQRSGAPASGVPGSGVQGSRAQGSGARGCRAQGPPHGQACGNAEEQRQCGGQEHGRRQEQQGVVGGKTGQAQAQDAGVHAAGKLGHESQPGASSRGGKGTGQGQGARLAAAGRTVIHVHVECESEGEERGAKGGQEQAEAAELGEGAQGQATPQGKKRKKKGKRTDTSRVQCGASVPQPPPLAAGSGSGSGEAGDEAGEGTGRGSVGPNRGELCRDTPDLVGDLAAAAPACGPSRRQPLPFRKKGEPEQRGGKGVQAAAGGCGTCSPASGGPAPVASHNGFGAHSGFGDGTGLLDEEGFGAHSGFGGRAEFGAHSGFGAGSGFGAHSGFSGGAKHGKASGDDACTPTSRVQAEVTGPGRASSKYGCRGGGRGGTRGTTGSGAPAGRQSR